MHVEGSFIWIFSIKTYYLTSESNSLKTICGLSTAFHGLHLGTESKYMLPAPLTGEDDEM